MDIKNCARPTLECRHRNRPCKLFDKSIDTSQLGTPLTDEGELKRNAEEYKKITTKMLKFMMNRNKKKACCLFYKMLKMKTTPTKKIMKKLYNMNPKYAIRNY